MTKFIRFLTFERERHVFLRPDLKGHATHAQTCDHHRYGNVCLINSNMFQVGINIDKFSLVNL